MYETSARYRQVINGSHRAVVRLQALTTVQFGANPTGGTEIPVLSGTVRLSSRNDVKGTLEVTIPGDYWELVQPYGVELFAERGVDFGDGTREYVPLGYYRIEEPNQELAPYGPIRIEAKDRMAHLIDSRLVYPYQYPAGTTHRQLFERLVNQLPEPESVPEPRRGYGMYIYDQVPIRFEGYDPDRATVPAGVCEDDVYEHLAGIVDARGCILRFNRHGELCVTPRDVAPGTAPAFRVEPGKTGNLIKASRRTSRKGVYNLVVARGSDPANPTGARLAYNEDPASPLRWYGPFGVITRFYTSPVLRTPEATDAASETVLARYKGLPSGLAVATVPDPSVDPLDPCTIVVGGQAQSHLVDEVEIPLVGDAPVTIETRTLNEVPDDPGTEQPAPDPENPGGGDPDPDPGTGGGTGGGPASSIGQLLNVGSPAGFNSVNVGVGYAPGDAPGTSSAKHVDYGRTDIENGLNIPKYFELVPGPRARMSAPLNGGRTSTNTKYPRVEFRELQRDGTTKASWNPGKDTHQCFVRSRVTRMPPNKPQLVLCQVHDSSDDTVMIRMESKTQVVAKFGDTIVGVLTNSFAFDTDYDFGIEVVNGQIRWYWGAAGSPGVFTTPVFTHNGFSGVSTGQYFKAGCYAQSWGGEPDSRGEPTDDVEDGPFVVEMSAFQIWHTGYPEPIGFGTIGTPGTGGGSGGGEPDTGSGSGTSPVPAGATLKFSSDFDGSSPLAGWGTVQNKNYNGNSGGASLSQYPLTVVNGGPGHETACRFEVRPGDTAISGERSELRFPGDSCNVSSGDERWFEFDLRFEPGFQGVSTSAWLIVFQLHPNDSVGGSPQLDLTVREDETLRLRLHETTYLNLGGIDAGVWHRYTLHCKFSASDGSALNEVWRDGVKVASSTERNLKSGSSSGNYFKTGIYRKAASFTSILQLDRVRVWEP